MTFKMEQTARISINVRVRAALKHEGDWYIAAIHSLDLFSQGRSEQEALKNLTEALSLFMQSCFERGTLNQVLLESGFHPLNADLDQPLDEDDQSDDDLYIDVPIPLVAQHAASNAC